MKNKRWTPQINITESLLKSREKRKWQIALRRYVLKKQGSSFYAPYFGIDILGFRQWIELQFDSRVNWDNFGETWQFDHVLPLTYFDLSEASDLRLCWNFINIRVGGITDNNNLENRIDVIAAKAYFGKIFEETGYLPTLQLVKKIEKIELSQVLNREPLVNFIKNNSAGLSAFLSFSSYEFDQLNNGRTLGDVLAEKEMLEKFGK